MSSELESESKTFSQWQQFLVKHYELGEDTVRTDLREDPKLVRLEVAQKEIREWEDVGAKLGIELCDAGIKINKMEGRLNQARQLAQELEWQLLHDCHYYLKLTKLLDVLDGKTSLLGVVGEKDKTDQKTEHLKELIECPRCGSSLLTTCNCCENPYCPICNRHISPDEIAEYWKEKEEEKAQNEEATA